MRRATTRRRQAVKYDGAILEAHYDTRIAAIGVAAVRGLPRVAAASESVKDGDSHEARYSEQLLLPLFEQ